MATAGDRPPPSISAIVIATGILAAVGGYFIGQASSLGLFGGGRKQKPGSSKKSEEAADDDDDDESAEGDDAEVEDEEDEEDEAQDLADFSAEGDECKLVLVVRTDLGMTKGKIAAQCGHATLACYKALVKSDSPAARSILQRWERLGQAKVALQVKSEEELELLQAQAVSLGVCARVIHDQGRTQIAAGSATVLGVGPAPKAVVDRITGHLKLL